MGLFKSFFRKNLATTRIEKELFKEDAKSVRDLLRYFLLNYKQQKCGPKTFLRRRCFHSTWRAFYRNSIRRKIKIACFKRKQGEKY